MGQRLSPEDANLYRLCDEALFYVWDPIGVQDAPEARDEYQSYLPQAFSLVRAEARHDLLHYLLGIGGERMGLRPDLAGAARAADFMLLGRDWVRGPAAIRTDAERGLTPQNRRLYRLCDEALFYGWDPIGVSDSPEARAEYQSYLPNVFATVETGSREELAEYLVWVAGQMMDLSPDPQAAIQAADFMFRAREWIAWQPAS